MQWPEVPSGAAGPMLGLKEGESARGWVPAATALWHRVTSQWDTSSSDTAASHHRAPGHTHSPARRRQRQCCSCQRSAPQGLPCHQEEARGSRRRVLEACLA